MTRTTTHFRQLMNQQQLHEFVQQLKRQPKVGMALSGSLEVIENQLAGLVTNFENAVDSMERTGIGLDNVIGNIANSIVNLSDDTTAYLAGANKMMGMFESLTGAFEKQIDTITKLYQRNDTLRNSFGMTDAQAQDYGYDLDVLSETMNAGRDEIDKYIGALGDMTDGYARFGKTNSGGGIIGKEMLDLQRYFTTIVGASDEAAAGMQGFIALSGKDQKFATNLRDQSLAIESMTGQLGVQRQVLEEIGGLSSETRLQFSRMPGNLAMSVMKLKQMGLSMTQLTTTGDSLLNIESSVGEEMEYQALTGQRLVKDGKSLTNEYRKAYLAGNHEKMAQTLADAYETQKGTLKNSMMARKAYEKMFGLEDGAVAKMIEKEEIINKLRADDSTKKKLLGLTGKDLQDEIDRLKSAGTLSIDATEVASLMELDDTRSFQDKIAEQLNTIVTKGIRVQFTDKADYTGKYAEARTKATEQMAKFEQAMVTNTDSFAKMSKELNTAVGKQQLLSTSLTAIVGSLDEFAKTMPIIGTRFGDLSAFYTSMTGVTLADFGKKHDAVMMNDGFMQFNPRDKFVRVNDGMTVAGTNVGGIDRYAAQMEKRDSRFEQTMTRLLSNMASQIKQGVETANIKINVDKTFSTTTMNRGRYA